VKIDQDEDDEDESSTSESQALRGLGGYNGRLRGHSSCSSKLEGYDSHNGSRLKL
ncbi:14047_t:CDS:2, partial [Funneliformis mosseae]